ncbi:hypothetical protein SAMN02745121_08147 [Nannocystis exedens]|uniref:Uncharacterized protein n=1 Tax=Nannocystis exedens TaxID=54 RepID=A0A1I2HSG5_9BACT|nr:hypothetical protein [Nannocystis exedens]PCC69397.1 hypothetical protein NAEX_02419 [Nannocystis exedens]SFF32260.1 hypothetical protein SAMN02745121_08147 [Nannocystis exedens]
MCGHGAARRGAAYPDPGVTGRRIALLLAAALACESPARPCPAGTTADEARAARLTTCGR